nr:hypothetical protein [Gammaproteobacteria bacterium]
MSEWIVENLGQLAAGVTVFAFVVSFATLAFSAFRYVAGVRQSQENVRFTTYHRLLRVVSTGSDEKGLLKLVSQIAYIHELTNFRKYDPVTYRVLRYLRNEWLEREQQKPALFGEVDRALHRIERRRWIAMRLNQNDYAEVRAQQGHPVDARTSHD